MRFTTRRAAAALLGSALAAAAHAQPPAPGAPAAPPAGVPAAPPAAPGAGLPAPAGVVPAPKPEPRPTGTAATVNNVPIPEVAVFRALRQFPPAHHETARKEIVNHLVENSLIDQYLAAIKVAVEDKEVDTLIGELKKELAAAKKDYSGELDAMLLTEAEFRAEVLAQLRWEKFVTQQGTDAALKQLFDGSPDVFDGSAVRASHILFTPGADPGKKQEAEAQLRGIKLAIEQEAAKAVAALPPTADNLAKEEARARKTKELFAAFAARDSKCPTKKDGGDLNYFPRAGAMVEPFAKAAFEAKPNTVTDPVASDFGVHLILVTDRKPGTQKKFEDVKEDVKTLYAMRLREAVLNQMKPKAQITVNPAPAPAGAVAAPPATPAPGAGPAVPPKP